jgi:hypothetical protein
MWEKAPGYLQYLPHLWHCYLHHKLIKIWHTPPSHKHSAPDLDSALIVENKEKLAGEFSPALAVVAAVYCCGSGNQLSPTNSVYGQRYCRTTELVEYKN